GNGTVRVRLLDDGSIRDAFGRTLAPNPAAFVNATTFAVNNVPWTIATGDFNGDGRLDLISVNRTSQVAFSTSLLLGNGDGTFQPITSLAIDGDLGNIVVGDLNIDGKLDIAMSVTTGAGGSVAISFGNGDGSFQRFATYPTGSAGLAQISIADIG